MLNNDSKTKKVKQIFTFLFFHRESASSKYVPKFHWQNFLKTNSRWNQEFINGYKIFLLKKRKSIKRGDAENIRGVSITITEQANFT